MKASFLTVWDIGGEVNTMEDQREREREREREIERGRGRGHEVNYKNST